MKVRAGVHATKKKIRVVLWDGAAVVGKHKRGHRSESLAELTAAVAEAVQEVLEAHAEGAEVDGLGLALPAYVRQEDGVVTASTDLSWLVGQSVTAALSERLQVPVKADVEAHCAVWGRYLEPIIEHKRDLPTLALTSTLYGGAAFIIDGEILHGEGAEGFEFGALLQRLTGESDGGDDVGAFTLSALVRLLAAKRGLKLKKKDAFVEACQKAAKGNERAAAVLEEAAAPIGVMIRAMRRTEELKETDCFHVLHAASAEDEVGEFFMPVTMAASCYLSQSSTNPTKFDVARGAAQL